MNLTAIIGKKIDQAQSFLENGKRIPISRVWVGENIISQTKSTEHDGYSALQIAFDSRNKISKPLTGHMKKAGSNLKPRFLREIRVEGAEGLEVGSKITAGEVLKPGDTVDVVGVSKGKGFAGVVKRWGFHGGPKTHGQSDRHRAPGSIGQSTTPGRVYKGKKMAGRMGNARVTIKNLEVIEVKDGEIFIKGLLPGPKGGVLIITKVGENKKFKPLYSTSSNSDEAEFDSKEETQKVASDSTDVESDGEKEKATEQGLSEEKVEEVKAETKEEGLVEEETKDKSLTDKKKEVKIEGLNKEAKEEVGSTKDKTMK